MVDLYCDWGADLSFSPSNDLRIASGKAFANQRVIRRLLTNPLETDSNGVTTIPAGDLFTPAYGAGLTADVESKSSSEARGLRRGRIKDALNLEPCIDQSQPIEIQFGTRPADDIEIVLIQFTTIEGIEMVSGLALN